MKSKRYDTSGLIDAQFEQGSHDKVLKNLLAIKTIERMDQAEALALADVQDLLIRSYDKNHRFTAKDNFKFATAAHIPNLMQDFEATFLNIHHAFFRKTKLFKR